MKNSTLASLLVLTLLATPACVGVAQSGAYPREVFTLKYASAQDMTNKLEAAYPSTQIKFVADERSNSVIVVADAQSLAEIQKIIRQLDVEVK